LHSDIRNVGVGFFRNSFFSVSLVFAQPSSDDVVLFNLQMYVRLYIEHCAFDFHDRPEQHHLAFRHCRAAELQLEAPKIVVAVCVWPAISLSDSGCHIGVYK
jgi:hypothetical protein